MGLCQEKNGFGPLQSHFYNFIIHYILNLSKMPVSQKIPFDVIASVAKQSDAKHRPERSRGILRFTQDRRKDFLRDHQK
jgi:hypothetical protein